MFPAEARCSTLGGYVCIEIRVARSPHSSRASGGRAHRRLLRHRLPIEVSLNTTGADDHRRHLGHRRRPEITREDVDRAYRRSQDESKPLSDEEALTAKLTLLNDLIVQQLLLAKAAALKLEIPQNELDTAYSNAKKNLSDDAFQQELNRRKLTAADMREGLRHELLTQKVLEQEVGSKITISDKEVTDFFTANRAQFNVPEEAYRIAQIVVTPVRDPQVANGTGDDATTPQAAVAKVRMLMERLKAGASFRDMAAGYSEDPESAPRGGDMGLVPLSKLKQVQPALRDAVLNKNPGAVNVVNAGGAYTIVLVVGHEAAGQRDLSTPGVHAIGYRKRCAGAGNSSFAPLTSPPSARTQRSSTISPAGWSRQRGRRRKFSARRHS